MAVRSRRLRLAGHGRRLHLRTLGDWTRDPMDGVAEIDVRAGNLSAERSC
jgi:hypothetical protein